MIFISRTKQSRNFLFELEQCILPVYMCIFFHWDRRLLRGSIGQICQNSPIHGICHWLSRARAVTGSETKLSWARAVTGWETTLGRAWPVTGWETTRPLLFKGIRCPIIVKGVRHPVFFFLLRNYCNSTLLWPTWIKLNLMTYELNVDSFYYFLFSLFFLFYFFSIFVILHDIGMESGSIESHDPGFSCWQILRPIGAFFYFRYFIW